VVLGPNRSGSTLGLTDFFNPSTDWAEGSYDIASQKGLQGIAATISGCSADQGQSLELRLADYYKSLTFSVGQSNQSDANNQILTVSVTANGRQVQVKNIPFNTVQPFSVPVPSVNSLVITFYLNSEIENCGAASVQAVLFKPVVS